MNAVSDEKNSMPIYGQHQMLGRVKAQCLPIEDQSQPALFPPKHRRQFFPSADTDDVHPLPVQRSGAATVVDMVVNNIKPFKPITNCLILLQMNSEISSVSKV